MSTTQTATGTEVLTHKRISQLLARRRNYQQEIQDITRRYQYVVFYGCGAILSSIIETWNEYVGRPIDFCCDSNSEKWGKKFCGIQCLSPQELARLKDKCAVFVTIGEFQPVLQMLVQQGFPSVNLIYKYDLVSSAFLATHDHHEIAANLCKTREMLSDQRSVEVFDSILERVLDGSRSADLMLGISERNQYFAPDVIKLSGNERFVDIGAYDGDTIRDLVDRTRGEFGRIFSFEVDQINFGRLQENVSRMPARDRIKVFNLGIWDSERDITYSIGNSQSTIGAGQGKGHVVPLDHILKDEPVSFIKMDIEGAEPQALRGASTIIRTQRPKLAVCVYHDIRHLWEIPLYIKALVPEYRIFLRHHTNLEYETVCYAII